MIFTLPLGRGVSKARSQYGWGTKFHSFWCCYGTGDDLCCNLIAFVLFSQVLSHHSYMLLEICFLQGQFDVSMFRTVFKLYKSDMARQ